MNRHLPWMVAPRLARIVLAPWRTAPDSTRWLAYGLFIPAALAAIALSGATLAFPARAGMAHAGELALFCYALGLGCLWFLWLSALPLAARDGRRLRVPGVFGDAVASLWAYALLGAAAPALIAAVFGGNVVLAFQLPAIAIAASLAVLLSPRWLATLLACMPAASLGLRGVLDLPTLRDPSFAGWAWATLAVLLAFAAAGWRGLVRSEDNDDTGWSSTMILQTRRTFSENDWWALDRNWSLRRSAGHRAAVDFRAIGPTAPGRAIRVVLGGWYLPQTRIGRLNTCARMVLPILLIIPLLWLINMGHPGSLRRAAGMVGIESCLWIMLFGIALLALALLAILKRRWRSASDLAILALLPGLDGARGAALLARTVFMPPAVAFGAAWLALLVAAALLRLGWMPIVFATIFEAGAAALTVTLALQVWTGQTLRLTTKAILGVVLLALINTSAVVVLVAPAHHGPALVFLPPLLVLAWSALIVWVLAHAVRAWRVLRRRPHPYLANAS